MGQFGARLPVVIAMLMLAACADSSGHGTGTEITRPLAGNVGGVNGSWTGGTGGYQLVYSIQDIGGEAAVCGLYRIIGSDNSRASRQVIRDYQLVVGETLLRADLSYFTRVDTEQEMFQALATCALTGLPWEDRFLNQQAALTGARPQYRN